MSDIYDWQIQKIGYEFLAAKGTLDYATRYWHRESLYNAQELQDVKPQDIKNAAQNLETTFFIRLFAMFEGILKEHLAQHHPRITVPEDARAVWLIDRVAVLQSPAISTPLRQKIHAVRKYRNLLVHTSSITMPPVTFSEALLRLSTYLSKLPEPRS